MRATFLTIFTIISLCSIGYAAEQNVDVNTQSDKILQLITDAENGDPIAQMNLGHEYFIGDNVPKDYNTARVWYEKSLMNGNGKVGLMLSQIYELGLGVEVSMSRAREYLNLGASSREIASMCQLSEYLKTGELGFEINLVEAEEWDEKLKEIPFDCSLFK